MHEANLMATKNVKLLNATIPYSAKKVKMDLSALAAQTSTIGMLDGSVSDNPLIFFGIFGQYPSNIYIKNFYKEKILSSSNF